ncbi:hypothetical protein NW762_007472 [Fusarium torreyae]|uniref:Xylanolytic transcriptional activator regulatory domain-containing protein n=1 Tax=Fusarium torreyae TaxID=1237075 RepID=A0A9W8RX25_9HYPO|nr:hypothetical protein NW762_007472 [Fusarium torreyae]
MQQLQDQLAQYEKYEDVPEADISSKVVDFDDEATELDDYTIKSMKLPPLQQTMYMVGIYLNTFNSLLPLFHADTLLRLVGETYALQPRQRDPVAWAAINVVLALAYQHMPRSSDDDGLQSRNMDHHLNRAQSVISAVTLDTTRLLNVQTLVGMAMLLQASHDLTPTSILISAAMRLAHKMGLHDRAASAHLDPLERRQRARVFWLAYMTDKDLSLRTEQPSIQLDDDIDIDLPSSLPELDNGSGADAGTVITADGNARMNYFLARVQLANIQGGIYDHLYSTRSSKRSLAERKTTRESIVDALKKWRASVPPQFGAGVDAMTTGNNPATTVLFCVLHSSSLHSLMMIERAHARNEQWITGIRDHGRGTRALQLPSDWIAMVEQARDYMILFEKVCSTHKWLRWMASCPYTSSMVVLMANNLHDLRHTEFQKDSERIDKVLSWFSEVKKELPSKEADLVEDICSEAIQTMSRRRAGDIAMRIGADWLVGLLNGSEPC